MLRISSELLARFIAVANKAAAFRDVGVLDWANRALGDAKSLGYVRDRDLETLQRLERTYAREYYNSIVFATA